MAEIRSERVQQRLFCQHSWGLPTPVRTATLGGGPESWLVAGNPMNFCPTFARLSRSRTTSGDLTRSLSSEDDLPGPPHNPEVTGSNPVPATKRPGQGPDRAWLPPSWGGLPPALLKGFYRLLRCPDRSRDELFEHAGGVGLHAREHVPVGLDREARRGVAEPFADDLDGNAGCDEQRAVGVAQLVQPDDRHAGASGDAFEGLGDGVGMDGSPPPSVNIHLAASMPAARCSACCHSRHAVRMPTVVGSRSMRLRDRGVFPRVSCTS
jgi:hypothetical protein